MRYPIETLLLTPHCALFRGDAGQVGEVLAPESVDAIVCDPPAGISFMNKGWDGDRGGRDAWIAWLRDELAPAIACLKPGGHVLAWAIPRTSHWTATALEDAGLEIRDVVMHLFGTGFPKSLSVHKASIPRVESRYGKRTCVCMDPGNGLAPGEDAGLADREDDRSHRERAARSARQAGDSVIPIDKDACRDAVRELRHADAPSTQSGGEISAPVLLDGLRGSRTEAEGHGPSALRPGMEKSPGRGQEARPGVQVVRYSADLAGAARTSSEAVSVRRDEPAREPGVPVRLVSPHDRIGDHPGTGVDSDRHRPRGVVPDDLGGRRDAVARVCSWCGLPDQGWIASLIPLGSALKPAAEHWILARKPLRGTVAANVTAYGTGALNIGACRIGTEDTRAPVGARVRSEGWGLKEGAVGGSACGRWPAHLTLDEEAAAMLDEQAGGATGSHGDGPRDGTGIAYKGGARGGRGAVAKSTGGPSRFFYVAKATRAEKDAGLDHLPLRTGGEATDREDGSAGLNSPRAGAGRRGGVRNHHPTAKSVALMRWLIRLITPPGGLVLDPFAGSGTTGIAALAEGCEFVGFERDRDDDGTLLGYGEVAKARLEHALAPKEV